MELVSRQLKYQAFHAFVAFVSITCYSYKTSRRSLTMVKRCHSSWIMFFTVHCITWRWGWTVYMLPLSCQWLCRWTVFCLQQLQQTTASSITKAIIDLLQKHNIPLEKIFWLALDWTSNISKTKNGVQTQLKTELRNSRYIHCWSHFLSMAALLIRKTI